MTPALAFYTVPKLRFPHNNREFYLARELASRRWGVHWMLPASGSPGAVPLEWPELRFPDLDVRGRTYLLPLYLVARLRRAGVRAVWISGWSVRSFREIRWLFRTLRAARIRIVYDPIDPICEYSLAQNAFSPAGAQACFRRMRRIYEACDLVVAVTPEMRELLVRNGAPADRTIVARWGSDASLFDPRVTRCDLKERLGVPADTFLAGWLGTMEPFKGLEQVILPLMEAVHEAGHRIHFVLAGRGTLEERIRSWAAERPRLPLTLLPTIPYEEAPAFTGSLDAYLVPTNPKTDYARAICPVKCFDALAMGTRLIVTRTRATEFLADRGSQVSLAEFNRDSFFDQLVTRYAEWQIVDGRRQYDTRDSHQAVSVHLADAIERLLAG
jgi:glycosyltransferase involved in cell wall biosynthesis